MSFVQQYLEDSISILQKIDQDQIERIIQILLDVRHKKGRLFLLGVGGSAASCIHAANDFRKLANIETYSPIENIAEITARTNNEGWHTVFAEWLKCSHLGENDAVLVFSVGGGSKERNVSANIVYALEYAQQKKARILGIVGRDGGFTAHVADACVMIPALNPKTVTPHTEGLHGVIWHLITADPRMEQIANKWESIASS